MSELSKKEIKVLDVFESGLYKKRGYHFLLQDGLPEEEIDKLIEKLKKGGYLEEFEAPEGIMLCTLYFKISIQELDKLKNGLADL